MSPARRRGLSDEVADRIREAIFSGACAPGAQLREVEPSAVLDVSRGPLREALRALEREGLVHWAWHRGTTATTLSPEHVAELDSLRAALEDLAVRQVIMRALDEDLASLAKAAEMMKSTSTSRDTSAASRREHHELVTALCSRDRETALHLFAAHRRHAVDVVTENASPNRVPRAAAHCQPGGPAAEPGLWAVARRPCLRAGLSGSAAAANPHEPLSPPGGSRSDP